MSDWYWRVIALKAAFVLSCFVSYINAEDTLQKLPFCNPQNDEATSLNDLVIVSTLDGHLTAFSTHDGTKIWHLETQALLASNLHHVELSSGGKWVRLVPSLRGTLYSVSGDTIEPLPFDAEQLLSSSFKYSDDLVIAGSHESSWLGLDALTGGVVYECGTSGCSGEQAAARADRQLLVLRRQGNTVRALDPRTGAEKWNFSVAEHQLSLSSNHECLSSRSTTSPAVAMVVGLPEGVVALRHPDSESVLWQRQLEAPVAGMWRLTGSSLQSIDLLSTASRSLEATAPSLYIGVHNKQLYVQESQLYSRKLESAVSVASVPWKLQHSRPLLTAESDTALTLQDAAPDTLSLIALYGNTGLTGNHGFFLYYRETCDEAVQVPEPTDDEDIPERILPNESDNHQHIHVHVYSLWFWWKEVLLIAISSALLMNLMIWPRFFAPKFRPPTPLPVNQEYIVVERHYERPLPNNTVEYSGRYETDFTPLRCLGRGGFGVVFEARNNIDHCSYAVKRITLPRRQSKRERVLREVRALAKLEHENIVRYFNAWLEEPPPHWQEQRDAQWMRELEGVTSMSEEYTAPPLPAKSAPNDNSVKLNLQKCVDDCVEALEYEKQLTLPSKRLRSHSCNDSFIIVFDENASKHPEVTGPGTGSVSKHGTVTSDATPPSCQSRDGAGAMAAADNDDSFIVFAQSEHSKTKNNSFDKRLSRVKECDTYIKSDSSTQEKKKKKGHTRHWSLDLCASGGAVAAEGRSGPSAVGIKMYLYIQMQLCRRDSLHDWLREHRTTTSRGHQVKTLFSQIVSAVEYVHLAGLIHRDLKPSNIFFAPDGRVKVGDFGLVTTMGDNSSDGPTDGEADAYAGHTNRVGTHLYMSPEQQAGLPYSYKVDIYSLGVILFELLQPFGTEAERVAALLRLRTGRYPDAFQEQYPAETDVLKLMLSEDPMRRPTASGVRARAPLYQHTERQWDFALPVCTAQAVSA